MAKIQTIREFTISGKDHICTLVNGGLLCPYCGHSGNKGNKGSTILDSRLGDRVRRRVRLCSACERRFRTVEYIVPGNDTCRCPACVR